VEEQRQCARLRRGVERGAPVWRRGARRAVRRRKGHGAAAAAARQALAAAVRALERLQRRRAHAAHAAASSHAAAQRQRRDAAASFGRGTSASLRRVVRDSCAAPAALPHAARVRAGAGEQQRARLR
jgi:hypothetical protein